MNRHGSIRFPIVVNVILVALIIFELTSVLTYADDESLTFSDSATTVQESTTATVADVEEYVSADLFPDPVFRKTLLEALESYYSDTDWSDSGATVQNNADVLKEFPKEAPKTFSSASDVLSWWGGTMTLPADCSSVDGVQHLGKSYYYVGSRKHEQTPAKIVTTSDRADMQEFFGSTYGNPDVIIYVDIDGSSMRVMETFGQDWDSASDNKTTIPTFAHTLELTFNMQQAYGANSLIYLRDLNPTTYTIKTGLKVNVNGTGTKSFGPSTTNSNPDSLGIPDGYDEERSEDGWTLKPKAESLASDSSVVLANAVDGDMRLFLVPGVGDYVNKTFYLFKTTADQSTVKSNWKTVTTTLGYCVSTKYVSSLDADYTAQLYGGFTFKKTSSVADNRGVAGAKYVVKNTDGKYLRVGADNSASEFVDTLSLATRFETGDDGTFTVANLPLGYVEDADADGMLTATYSVVEVEPPAGYALDPTPISVTVTGDASGIATTFDGGEGSSVSVASSNNTTYTPNLNSYYSKEPTIYSLVASDKSTKVESSHDCYIANRSARGGGVLGTDLYRMKYAILDTDTDNYSAVQTPTFRLEDLQGNTVLTATSLDELKTKINEDIIYANAMQSESDSYVIKASGSMIYYDNNSTSTSVVEYPDDAASHHDTPLPANIELQAEKKLWGADLSNDQFSFTLTPVGTIAGDPVPKTGITVSNDESGKINFGELSYTLPGTYTYSVKENTDDSSSERIHFDSEEKTITVVVTEQSDGLHVSVNGNGDFSAAESNVVTYNQEGQIVTSNPVEADSGVTFTNYLYVNLSGKKQWNDSQDFLGMRPTGDEGQSVRLTVYVNGEKMDPQPTINWDTSTDSQDFWTYTIKELPKVDENGNSITYKVEETKVNNYKDAEVIKTEVQDTGDLVTDFRNSLDTGELKISKTTAASDGAGETYFEFVVTLAKPNGSSYIGASYVLPKGSVVALNDDGSPKTILTQDTQFTYDGSFKLYLKDNYNITIKDIMSGASYVVTETKASGYNEVSNKAGTISSENVANEKFTNTLEVRALQFDKTVINSADVDENEEYTFTILTGSSVDALQPYSGDYIVSGGGIIGTEYTVGTGAKAVTVKGEKRNTTDGKVVIKKDQTVTFSANSDEDYFYKATEDASNPYSIIPAVVEGNSSFSTIEHFINVRKLPEPADVIIDVEKLLDKPEWSDLSLAGFEFLLSGTGIPTKATGTLATDTGSFTYDPSKGQWSATPAGNVVSYKTDYVTENISSIATSGEDGKAQFERFKIVKPGEYLFTVKEVVPDSVRKDMTYDTREVTVKVNVTLDKDSNKLVSTVTYEGGETGNADDGSLPRAFKNTQTGPDCVKASLELNKCMPGAHFDAGDFSFTRKDVSTDLKDGVEKSEDETVANSTESDEDGNSLVKFGDIEYFAPGTYAYEITENAGEDSGIIYSTQKITATVVIDWVDDEEKNELKVISVTYVDEDGNESNEFLNTFKIPKNTTYELAVNKVLLYENTDEVAEISDGQFEFALFDADGNAITDEQGNPVTARCTSDGKAVFPSFKVTYDDEIEAGKTVYYTIKEVKGSDSSITLWDQRTVTAKVNIWRDSVSNRIMTKVTYVGASGDDSNEFVNEKTKSESPDEGKNGGTDGGDGGNNGGNDGGDGGNNGGTDGGDGGTDGGNGGNNGGTDGGDGGTDGGDGGNNGGNDGGDGGNNGGNDGGDGGNNGGTDGGDGGTDGGNGGNEGGNGGNNGGNDGGDGGNNGGTDGGDGGNNGGTDGGDGGTDGGNGGNNGGTDGGNGGNNGGTEGGDGGTDGGNEDGKDNGKNDGKDDGSDSGKEDGKDDGGNADGNDNGDDKDNDKDSGGGTISGNDDENGNNSGSGTNNGGSNAGGESNNNKSGITAAIDAISDPVKTILAATGDSILPILITIQIAFVAFCFMLYSRKKEREETERRFDDFFKNNEL